MEESVTSSSSLTRRCVFHGGLARISLSPYGDHMLLWWSPLCTKPKQCHRRSSNDLNLHDDTHLGEYLAKVLVLVALGQP